MPKLRNESLLTMTEATNEIPNRPDVSTLWRWRTRGLRGIKLETELIGGRRYTSREAMARFFDALNDRVDEDDAEAEAARALGI